MRVKDFHAPSFIAALFFSLASVLVLTIAGLFFSAPQAQAAHDSGFKALQVTAPQSPTVLTPGETKQLSIEFQNTGDNTWTNKGTSYISIYTYGPKYRESEFRSDDWSDDMQAARLQEDTVAPGETGRILVNMTAPEALGTYEETFHLAAEDTVWIPGGEFTLTLEVAKTPSQTDSTTSEDESTAASELSGMILLRSAKEVVAEGGEEIAYTVGVKNTGTRIWNTREILSGDLAVAAADTEHTSWVSSTKVAVKSDGQVDPGQLDFISFAFNAPASTGSHEVVYKMAVDGATIPDFEINIPVTVTSDAPEVLDDPIDPDKESIVHERTIEEPILRIGVMIVDEETDWQVEISCDSDWRLMSGSGGLLGQVNKGDIVRAFYKNQRYYFNRGKGIEQTSDYLRFVPEDDDAICTVENWDRRVTRNAGFADNTFRDALELRYNSTKDRTWLINELPVEEYLRGLAETSDYSHMEFKKTLITTARTYALYHWERATKHKEEFFHMNAYADDQVYKGYGYEMRHPSIGDAVEATEGVTVSYDGRTAITPYFSRSDGRTRDWGEVWYGDVPWIKSVPAPCDAKRGFELWGHGVGMSATEALCMANEGSTWDEILKYFYTGIDLVKRW